MFFIPPGMTPEQSEKFFSFINEARKKEAERLKKQEETQKRKDALENEKKTRLAEYELLLRNAPTTSITSMIGYAHMLNYCNPNQILKKE